MLRTFTKPKTNLIAQPSPAKVSWMLTERPYRSRSHEWIDQRSLAMERAVAQKLRSEPDLLLRAKNILERWIQQQQPDVPLVLLEWRDILDNWPLEKIWRLWPALKRNRAACASPAHFAAYFLKRSVRQYSRNMNLNTITKQADSVVKRKLRSNKKKKARRWEDVNGWENMLKTLS